MAAYRKSGLNSFLDCLEVDFSEKKRFAGVDYFCYFCTLMAFLDGVPVHGLRRRCEIRLFGIIISEYG